MDFGGKLDRHYDNLLNAHLRKDEEAEARAIAIDEYIDANIERAILDYMKDDGEFTIVNAFSETGFDNEDLAKITQFFKSYVKQGKLNTPEYAVIGKALCSIAYSFFEAECRAELEKESGL